MCANGVLRPVCVDDLENNSSERERDGSTVRRSAPVASIMAQSQQRQSTSRSTSYARNAGAKSCSSGALAAAGPTQKWRSKRWRRR